jgi:hypothetical protein
MKHRSCEDHPMDRARSGALVWLMLAGVLASPVAAAQPFQEAGPRQLYAAPAPLSGLIERLAGTPDQAHRELAILIVEALVTAYEDELDQALRERAHDISGQRKLSRWHQAAAPVLADLRIAQADLYAARRVELHTDRHGQILLQIDGRPLWVAWPRVTVQNRLEREVAAAFCRRHVCLAVGEGYPGQEPDQVSVVHGTWVFAQGRSPGWETADGLRCEFPNLSGRAAKEATCRRLAVDLYAVAAALRAAARRGERIDWAHLMLQQVPAADIHRIVVTEHGDFIAVAVPALAANPVDWAEARRWLRARLQDRAVVATILRAAEGG